MTASISGRLIILLTLIAAVALSASITLDYRLSRHEILQRLQLELRETIEGALDDLYNMLSDVEDATLFLGRVLEQQDYDRQELSQLLRDLVDWNSDVLGAAIALNPAYTDAGHAYAPYYYRRDGSVREVDLSAAERAYWDEDWYRQAAESGQPVWVEPYFDALGAMALMTTFSVPVYRPGAAGARRLYAVVTADIALRELQDYLQRLRLGHHGRSLLLSRAGTILSAQNPELVMRPVTDIAATPGQEQALQEMLADANRGRRSVSEMPCPWTAGTCKVLMAALPGPGWPVGIMYSERERLAPIRSYGVKAALFGLVLVVLMVSAVAWVTRRLTRPLQALAAASGEIARGKLDTPLPSAGRPDEVGRLVAAFGAMTRDLRHYIDDLEQATRSRSRLEGELAAASQIQMSLLPGTGDIHDRGPGYELAARVRPAKSVGGDLYHIHRAGDQLLFALGDVSDKGVPAALFMARAISLLQYLGDELDPAWAMARLNDALEDGNDNCMFVTLFIGRLALDTGELVFASAGHPPPMLLRDGAATELPQEAGPAIGLRAGLVFEQCRAQLRQGDRLTLYTDGVDEAFSTAREMFGLQRLQQSLQRSAGQSVVATVDAVFDAVAGFVAGAAQSDDITLLVLDWQAPPFMQAAKFRPGPRLVSRALDWIQDAAEPLQLSEDQRFTLFLLLEETVANIDQYAGLSTEQRIDVELVADSRALELRISDPGAAFNPLLESSGAELGLPTEQAPAGGLGVHLIRKLGDRHHYRRAHGRNILTLTLSRRNRGD